MVISDLERVERRGKLRMVREAGLGEGMGVGHARLWSLILSNCTISWIFI